jgi:nucleoside-triphosphatase THEP1
MELKSREFMDSLKKLLDVGKKVIVVVHQKIQHPLTEQFKKKSSLIIDLNLGNREKMFTKYWSIDYWLNNTQI